MFNKKECMNICLYFDSNYISRFLILEKSLKKFHVKVNFFILALDYATYEYFKKKNQYNFKVIKLKLLESTFSRLKIIKKKRSKVEYYFTLSPILPLYVKKKFNIKHLTYMDADFLFISNPKNLFKVFKNYSVAITKQEANIKYGKYNVGIIFFNFEYAESVKILNYWAKQCMDWCFDRCQDGKYADQKYLDIWPAILKKIKIFEARQLYLSPWDNNINNKLCSIKPIAFHFHGLKVFRNFFITGFYNYNKVCSGDILKLYKKYVYLIKKYNHIKSNQFLRYQNKNLFLRLIKFAYFFFKVSKNKDLFIIK